jgi:hypothetical protein
MHSGIRTLMWWSVTGNWAVPCILPTVMARFCSSSGMVVSRSRDSVSQGGDTGWIRQSLLQVLMNFQPFGEAKLNDVNELPLALGNGPVHVGCTVKSR